MAMWTAQSCSSVRVLCSRAVAPLHQICAPGDDPALKPAENSKFHVVHFGYKATRAFVKRAVVARTLGSNRGASRSCSSRSCRYLFAPSNTPDTKRHTDELTAIAVVSEGHCQSPRGGCPVNAGSADHWNVTPVEGLLLSRLM